MKVREEYKCINLERRRKTSYFLKDISSKDFGFNLLGNRQLLKLYKLRGAMMIIYLVLFFRDHSDSIVKDEY